MEKIRHVLLEINIMNLLFFTMHWSDVCAMALLKIYLFGKHCAKVISDKGRYENIVGDMSGKEWQLREPS
jgi:hypothetical protein